MAKISGKDLGSVLGAWEQPNCLKAKVLHRPFDRCAQFVACWAAPVSQRTEEALARKEGEEASGRTGSGSSSGSEDQVRSGRRQKLETAVSMHTCDWLQP